MSLMRLLSAGKSWVGLKDPGSRYQMGEPGMLPKFGSGRNPFGAKKTVNETDRSDTSDKSDQAGQPKNWAAKLCSLLGVRVKKRETVAPARAAGPQSVARPQLELSL